MRRIATIIFTSILAVAIYLPAHAADFTAMTTPLPPYSINKGLHAHGISIDVLTIIMTLSGSPMTEDDVKLMLWKHALQETERGPKRILLNMPRTKEVESKFKWVGPIHVDKFVIVGRKGAPLIGSLEDLSAYKTATIRDSLPEKSLIEAGIPKASLKSSVTHIIPLKKLKTKMVEYFVHSDTSATYLLTKMGMNLNDYEVRYTFLEMPIYYAFSKDTDNSLIKKLNNNLAKLKKPGKDGKSRYDKIVAKYLPDGTLQ